MHSFTRGLNPRNKTSVICNSPYAFFVWKAVRYARRLKGSFWLVLANRKATVPGVIIRRVCKPALVIQDCRELYLFKEVKRLSGKIGCFFERMMVQRADIVMCANQERCTLLQMEYNLSQTPIPYENLRMLEYESEKKLEDAKKRLDSCFHDDEIRIISSSGCSVLRTNDVLVKNLNKVEKKCRLFLVGDSSLYEKHIIEGIVEEKHLKNVEIIGRLNQTELKYLISKCHIGIVNYGKYDTNNLLCASGKLYEFLYEGLPVVTTENPPLKRICLCFGIGIADDSYYNGINMVINQYEEYKNRLEIYTNATSIKDNDKQLIEKIRDLASIKLSGHVASARRNEYHKYFAWFYSIYFNMLYFVQRG